jgi:hypothetical protein
MVNLNFDLERIHNVHLMRIMQNLFEFTSEAPVAPKDTFIKKFYKKI